MSDGGVWLCISSVELEGGQMCEENRACMGVSTFLEAWRNASGRMKPPLQKVYVGSRSFTPFEAVRRLFYIPTAVVGCRAWQRKDKLRVRPSRAIDPVVCC